MIRKSVLLSPPMFLNPRNRKICFCITNFVLVQCVLLYLGSATVLNCVWKPNLIPFDPYKLASIMYLYDKKACGHYYVAKSLANLKLSNDTRGLNVRPIRWEPALATVTTRLSEVTRTYIKLSIAIHIIWMTLAFLLCLVTKKNNRPRLLHYTVTSFFYMTIFVIIFDLSMAIVYVTHIKQSLTKGMIVRNTGWSAVLEKLNNDDFAGYLPLIASICWMRGIVLLGFNIYCCKSIHDIRCKMKKREIMTRCIQQGHQPFPDAIQEKTLKSDTLYYRAGENNPHVPMSKSKSSMGYY